jgi:cytoskeletal protein RodZ
MDPKKESLRKIPTVHAPSVGGDIGAPLKAARQKKGLSIDNIAQQTRIPKKYLEAMENNRTDELPALVYLRGFLKGYCDFLELDFEPLWKQVTEPQAPTEAVEAPSPAAEAPSPKEAAKPEPKPEPRPAPVSEVKDIPKPKSYAKPVVRPAPKTPAKPTDDEPSKYAPPAPKPAAAKPAAAKPAAPKRDTAHHGHTEGGEHGAPPHRDLSGTIALTASIIVALSVFIWLKKQDSRPLETQTVAPVALAPVASQGAELTIAFKDETWISLRGDGVLLFEGLAPKGAQQKWKAQRGFVLRTPHAQDLVLGLNGAPYTLAEIGAEGEFKIE